MTDTGGNRADRALVGQMAAKKITKRAVQPSLADLTDDLIPKGYWPARASKLLSEGEYAQVIAICKEHLAEATDINSGLVLYALALYKTGQIESAETQFLKVLSYDPDNLVALKHLGDIKFAQNDQLAAESHYQRVLKLDSECRGLHSVLSDRPTTRTRTVTIKRGAEVPNKTTKPKLRKIIFYTETMGDLYLSQGHNRLAAEVFSHLVETGDNPRWQEKLDEANNKQTETKSGS